jgi:outer membrane receptor for ferrienterochelin and colicins
MVRRLLAFLMLIVLSLTAVMPNLVPSVWAQEHVDYELQPIVVTATRTPQPLWESTANVFVLTGEEIQGSTARHLGDALGTIPGISIGEYGGLGQNVALSMRGSTAGQVLVLVDGVPVNDLQLGGFDVNTLCLDNIDRVEVIRGAASSLYGADAMGGVINVITRQAPPSGTSSTVSYRQGDHGLEKITGRLARPLGKGLRIHLLGSKTDYDGFRQNSDYSSQHLDARLTVPLGTSSQLVYGTRYYDADLGVPGMEDLPTPSSRQQDDSWHHSLSWQASPGPGHNLRSMIYRQYSRQEFDNPDWLIEADHKRWVHGAEVQHTFSPLRMHTFTWGGEIQHRRLNSSENGRHDLNQGAMFAQDEIAVQGFLKARLTARYDYHQGFDDQINPGLTVTWLIRETASLFVSLRRAYRAPTFNDLYWPDARYDYDFDGQYDYGESGNPRIAPERAVSAQMGLRGRIGPLQGGLCLFHRRVDDLIQWDNVDDGYAYGYWMPVNTDRARIQGLEAHLEGTILSRLEGSLAYTYLDARDRRTDLVLPYQPAHRFSASLRSGLAVIEDQLELSAMLEFEGIGERYADSAEMEVLAAESHLHARIDARFLEHLTVYLTGRNLRDRRFVLRSGYPLPGRTFGGGLSWTFRD